MPIASHGLDCVMLLARYSARGCAHQLRTVLSQHPTAAAICDAFLVLGVVRFSRFFLPFRGQLSGVFLEQGDDEPLQRLPYLIL